MGGFVVPVVEVGFLVVVVPVPTSISRGIISHVLTKLSLRMTVPSATLTVRATLTALPDWPPVLITVVPGPNFGLGMVTSVRATTL